MKTNRIEFDRWNLDRPITVQVAGNVIDLTQTERPPRAFDVKWLDADSYIDLRSGEIKQAQHSESRGDAMSAANLRRTFKRMRALINSNWFGDNNELLITLTYKENMQDTKRLAHDLDVFNKRMKRALGEIKYLTAVEPQGRGAWHAHILVKQLTSHYTYWPHEDVSRCWEHGSIIDVQRLRNCDNVGAYLSAYLTDLPAEDGQPVTDPLQLREVGSAPKRVIKGGRLHLYPRGMRIYRASQNLTQPEIKKIRPYSAEYWALLQGSNITFKSTLELTETNQDNSSDYLFNKIHQMQLNVKGAALALKEKENAEIQMQM